MPSISPLSNRAFVDATALGVHGHRVGPYGYVGGQRGEESNRETAFLKEVLHNSSRVWRDSWHLQSGQTIDGTHGEELVHG